MSWVAVAIGAGTAIAGGVEANANRQRQKGLVGTAYETAQRRMNLAQLDTRQQVAEASGSRGLTGGGDVETGAPVTPGETVNVGGAHTLGAQQTLDEEREQALEQTSLKQQNQADLSNINANADQGIIGAAVSGIGTAFGVKGALNERAAANPGTSPAAGTTVGGTNTPSQDLASSSFGGVNPVHPLESGAWAPSTSSFNVNG